MSARRRSSLLAAWLFLGLPALVWAPANSVFAQSAAQVTATASSDEVEVGEAFTVDLKAMSENQESISSPELRAPSGFSVSGPIISTQTYMQFGSGGRRTMSGIGASWTLVPSAPGSFSIAAPSVMVNGQRIKASPLAIKVVPQGTRPQRQQGGFLFPGGPPKGLFGPNWPFSGTNPWGADPDLDEPGDDSSLNLPSAPNSDVFLHATVDKKSVVIGEQVTITTYMYYDPQRIADDKDQKLMPLTDFLKFELVKPDERPPPRRARAGGRRFLARMLERNAIFPLRTGTLHTGSYKDTFITVDRRLLPRASADIAIVVSEPPLANRPVGYRLGDVGQFQISALVQPRRVDEGGSVAVTVKVSGSGNFPTSLRMPEKTGVEWLDPEKKEVIEAKNGEITGYRSFGHVVRLVKSGSVDLGTIELPYWNPRAKRYEVARSALGTIDVVPSKTPAPVPTAAPSAGASGDDPFAHTPPPRATLSAFARPSEGALLEGPRFGFALAAPPLLALAGIAGLELSRRARARLASRKTSPATLANAALGDARRAKSGRDERAVAAAVERAIVLAIEAATGLKARGLMKEGLAAALVAQGVPEGVAQRAQDALGACDKARFDPLAAAEVRVEEAEALVSDLLKAKGP